jgi:outer membrane protein TolC
MRSILLTVGFVLALTFRPGAFAQPGTLQVPAGLPAAPGASVPGAPINLTLQDALERARAYSPQVYTAALAARIAHEDTVQAKAALLPSVNGLSQFIYTQPNGAPSGVFVSNDGPHVYNDQLVVHGDIWSPAKRADWHRATAAEALARARTDLAVRGLFATVVQNYYGLVVAQRKITNAQQSLREAEQLLDITRKLEQGGEAARADVVKAEVSLEQRRRDVEDAQLAIEKARIGLGILLFPNYGQPFTVTDDIDAARPLPPFPEIQTMAGTNNPEIRAAQLAVTQSNFEIASARAALLPSLSFDYFFGINANQFAVYDRDHLNNLGSAAQAQLTIPIWTWGAARSKVKQAELRQQQARNDLTLTQRTLLGELNSFYLEGQVAAAQVASLRRSVDLSSESLRLTQLRYQAGEATVLEVVDAQSTLAQARNASDDGLFRYRLALANLQTLTGAF